MWCGGEPCDVESRQGVLFPEESAKTGRSCVVASSCGAVNTANIACDGPDDCLGSNADRSGADGVRCSTEKSAFNLYTGEEVRDLVHGARSMHGGPAT